MTPPVKHSVATAAQTAALANGTSVVAASTPAVASADASATPVIVTGQAATSGFSLGSLFPPGTLTIIGLIFSGAGLYLTWRHYRKNKK